MTPFTSQREPTLTANAAVATDCEHAPAIAPAPFVAARSGMASVGTLSLHRSRRPPAIASPSAPLRICHLGKYYWPAMGGMESHVQTLARGQAALGHQVQVCCINHGRGCTRSESDGAVRISRFGRLASVAKIDVCID